MNHFELVEEYEMGRLTEGELFLRLTQSLTEDDALNFLAWTPPDVLARVEDHLRHCPDSEAGWANLRLAQVGSWGQGVTPERIAAETAEELRQHRRGVEVLRDVLGPRPRPYLGPAVLAWEGGTV